MYRARIHRLRRRTLPFALGVGLAAGILRDRTVWTKQRSEEWYEKVVLQTFDDKQWLQNFRMTKASLNVLCHELRPYLQPSEVFVRPSVPVNKQIAITVYWLASCAEYRTIGNLFGVHESTVCTIVHKVCDAIQDNLLAKYVKFPTGEDLRDVAERFMDRWHFPNCVGAIDGSHIEIIKPETNHGDYVNRKGRYSLNLQAICDDRYVFREVNIGWPGKVHDARVFANSDVYDRGENGTLFSENTAVTISAGDKEFDIPMTIVGDPAYPLRTYLMKPYPGRGNLPIRKTIFNYRLSRARMTIENSFGRLKGRWQVLAKRLDVKVEFACTVIAACCVLHNFCEFQKEEFDESLSILEESDIERDTDNESALEDGAKAIRDRLADLFTYNLNEKDL